jgi:4-diphosphocytidyl-2-C-methyl-D-erythritol kinase
VTGPIREEAPAKVNLVLHVGPLISDDRHAVSSLFASLVLHDVVAVAAGGDADEVVCPGVDGPNLAGAAIDAFRAGAPADLPPLRVEIEKRIPLAAGLAGGSADAAAVLRAANELAGRPLDDDGLRALAAPLGSDVPSQVRPAHSLVTGGGERVEPVALPPMWLVLVPSEEGLPTGDVYAEADRIGATRERLDPAALRELAARPLETIAASLENDLEAAALSLRPEIADALAALKAAGALGALVAGSGPTAFGVFTTRDGAERAAGEVGSHAIVTGLRSGPP